MLVNHIDDQINCNNTHFKNKGKLLEAVIVKTFYPLLKLL
jgi:hypothetical protein